MQPNKLEFQGYTWDDYFYVISNKKGILITYRGSLDNEGSVRLDEILYIAGAEALCSVYEGAVLKELRSRIDAKDSLFFSYAETDNYQQLANILVGLLHPKYNEESEKADGPLPVCEGACALFPKQIVNNK